jgi:hypothetical protein
VRDREYGESTTTTVEYGTGARTDAQQIPRYWASTPPSTSIPR